MSIKSHLELLGMQNAAAIVATVLKAMREYCKPGMSAKELDDFGGAMMAEAGAQPAPKLTYNFPGFTCISVNNEVAHGIPSAHKIFKEGDLINIDVSAELNGYWADNGGSFVLGADINKHLPLVNASRQILQSAINQIKGGVKIADIGLLIEKSAAKQGFKVIKNLAGHGIGNSLHEEPHDILNCYDKYNKTRFRKNSVVAIETFISTRSTYAVQGSDEWGLIGDKGGYVAQHEHTIVVTDGAPLILTGANGIWE
jgi:methionyl aminopeptidase